MSQNTHAVNEEIAAEQTVEDIIEFMDIGVIRDLLGSENYDLEKSLITTFLTDTKRRYEELKEALVAGDCSKINYLSHTIKGGAGNIGAKMIQENCKYIEAVSGEGALTGVAEYLDDLKAYISRLDDYFSENYSD